jgi:RNA polymerase sigma-70 factor, ECF subfamily
VSSRPSTPADAEPLVGRIRQGDEQALASVFREHYAALASFAYRYLRDAAAAEDAVHDVFGTLWTRRQALVVTTSLRAYLYAAVRNRCLNVRKHDDIVEAWETDTSSHDVWALHPVPAQPDELLDQRIARDALATAFESLPERQAQVMRLRWFSQLSYAEIAEAVGISPKGVEKHLSRGLAALRAALT